MENLLLFGTVNVPVASDDNLAASYSAPAVLSEEMMKMISFSTEDPKQQSSVYENDNAHNVRLL